MIRHLLVLGFYPLSLPHNYILKSLLISARDGYSVVGKGNHC